MQVIRDDSDVARIECAELRELIEHRISEYSEYVEHFNELVTFILVEPGDCIADVDSALGFSVLTNRFDGTPYGDAGFTPSWDVLEEHAGNYELVYVLSDDGAGIIVFISKTEGVPAQLLAMCRQYVTEVADK
jgi:hypothetical protein